MQTQWDATDNEKTNKLQAQLNNENKNEIHNQTLAILDILKKVGEAIGENKSVNVKNTIRQVTGKVAVEKPEWFKTFDQKDLLKKLDYIAGAIIRKEIPKKLDINRPDWIKELFPKAIEFPKTEKLEPRLREIIKAIEDQEFPEPVKTVSVKKPSWFKLPDIEKPILALATFIKKYFDKAIIKTEIQNEVKVKNPVRTVTVKNPQKEVKITNLKELEKRAKIITSQLQALGNTGGSGGGSPLDISGLATEAKQDDIIGNISPRKDLEGLGNKTVGTTQVEIVITGTPHTIRLRADTSNTGIIYIGKSGVLADGSNDFVRLESGDEIIIDYDDTTNALYAISNLASQKINLGIIL